jgi:putative transposase
MDWMYDELFDGRRLWVLTVVCHAVCRSATAMEVIDALEQARRQHGLPTAIRVDQGSQFPSKELDLWAHANDITLDFSRPGKPADNARGKLQCHGSARVPRPALVPRSGRRPRKVEEWRAEYNEVRPHSAIGDRTPLCLIHLPRQHVEASTRPEMNRSNFWDAPTPDTPTWTGPNATVEMLPPIRITETLFVEGATLRQERFASGAM